MSGLFRAELLRLRKRRSLQVIVLGVPLLIGAFFVLGYSSIYHQPAFDEAAERQQLIDSGYVAGLPPEEAEPILRETLDSIRQNYAMGEQGERLTRAGYLFPYSLPAVLGYGTLVLAALLLLTATVVGDELGWGTIRTTLLASGHRRRLLAVRLTALVGAGAVMLGLVLVAGTVLPFVLGVPSAALPASLPAFDPGFFLVLLGGVVVAGIAVVGFGALATLAFRSGPLALIALPIYVAVEAAILVALLRLPSFGGTQGPDGNFVPGPDAWLLEAFPLRGLTTLTTTLGRAATGLPSYPGEVVARELGNAGLPIVTYVVLALALGALAFRRFQRMDIVE